MTTTLLELAARIAAAERGTRDLDADIHEALGFEVIRQGEPGSRHAWRYRGDGQIMYSSIRWCALTDLTGNMQEAWAYLAKRIRDGGDMMLNIGAESTTASYIFKGEKRSFSARAKTPALAICAVALMTLNGFAEDGQ